jgi:hypothetical protein
MVDERHATLGPPKHSVAKVNPHLNLRADCQAKVGSRNYALRLASQRSLMENVHLTMSRLLALLDVRVPDSNNLMAASSVSIQELDANI